MDPLGDPLTTHPVETGWEFTMELYLSGQFGLIDDPDRHFGNGSVWTRTRTRTRSDGPEPLLTLDMHLALGMAKMAKGGFSPAAIEETQQQIKKPRAEVQEEKMRGVEFPGHNKVKAAIERHPAMVYKNHTAGCLPCHNGTAKNPQTRWRCKGTAALPPGPAAPLPDMPPPPGTPPGPPGDTDGNESYEIKGMPSKCVYLHSPLPITQFFDHNAYAKDSKRDKDFIPDLLSTLSAVWKYH